MESERKAIEKIATILKEFEEELINFAAANGYGGRSYPSDPAKIVASIRDFTNTTNSKIQAIRGELITITRDEDLVRKIMGN